MRKIKTAAKILWKKWPVWTAIFCSLPAAAFGQELLTLQQAVEIGLQNNYTIRISRNNAEIADNNASLGNAGFLPEVNVSARQDKSVEDTKQDYITGNTTDRTGARRSSRQAQVALNWTIFDGFKMFTTYGRLEKLQEVGEIEARQAVELTVADIINGYFDVVRQSKNLAVLKETAALSRERLRIARNNFEIGAGSRLSVMQAQVDLNADSSALLQQESLLLQARITLNKLLAREVETAFRTSGEIPLETGLTLTALKAEAMERNSSLQIIRQNRQIAGLDVKEAYSEWLPQVDLFTNYNWAKSESQSGFLLENQSSGYTYGVSLSLNLFNGFNSLRRRQNAKITLQNRKVELQEAQTRLSGDLARTFDVYRNSLQRVDLERENLEVARRTLNISMEQFRLGTITAIELRENQRNYINAENRLIAAEYSAKQAETDLLRLSGRLISGHPEQD